MIPALLALLGAQLAGETLSRSLNLPLPGPVVGLLLLLAAFAVSPRLAETLRPLSQGILGNLSLLFVPAGVGVVGHIDTLGANGGPILLAVLISTVLAIAVGALSFSAVAHLTGNPQEPDE
ncbi:MAG: CidA/LrgA family protein [Paracoccaceae bacterium]